MSGLGVGQVRGRDAAVEGGVCRRWVAGGLSAGGRRGGRRGGLRGPGESIPISGLRARGIGVGARLWRGLGWWHVACEGGAGAHVLYFAGRDPLFGLRVVCGTIRSRTWTRRDSLGLLSVCCHCLAIGQGANPARAETGCGVTAEGRWGALSYLLAASGWCVGGIYLRKKGDQEACHRKLSGTGTERDIFLGGRRKGV